MSDKPPRSHQETSHQETSDAVILATARVAARQAALYRQDRAQALGTLANVSGEPDKQNKPDEPSERIDQARLCVKQRKIDKYRQDYRQATSGSSNSGLQAQQEL